MSRTIISQNSRTILTQSIFAQGFTEVRTVVEEKRFYYGNVDFGDGKSEAEMGSIEKSPLDDKDGSLNETTEKAVELESEDPKPKPQMLRPVQSSKGDEYESVNKYPKRAVASLKFRRRRRQFGKNKENYKLLSALINEEMRSEPKAKNKFSRFLLSIVEPYLSRLKQEFHRNCRQSVIVRTLNPYRIKLYKVLISKLELICAYRDALEDFFYPTTDLFINCLPLLSCLGVVFIFQFMDEYKTEILQKINKGADI